MIEIVNEASRFYVDASLGKWPFLVKIRHRQSDVEVGVILLQDVNDLIFALRRAQLQMVTIVAKDDNSSASPHTP